jgi:nitrous oxidase accessory protein NosD
MKATLMLLVVLTSSTAAAAVIHVPRDEGTLQDAVDGANDGDVILVAPGDYCGATIDKRVTLLGWKFLWAQAPTIVGCAEGPALPGGLRIGLFLPGTAGANAASGTLIAGFAFDGEGVGNDDLAPLAFGVFARFTHDVRVVHNRFHGTVQAITNTAGDHWTIANNRIRDLSLFDCLGARCGGGSAIVVQVATGGAALPGGASNSGNRPQDNAVFANTIGAEIPDQFDVFDLTGILVLAADRTTIVRNRIVIPDNASAAAQGLGIAVSNLCCGSPERFVPGARTSVIVHNDVRRSEVGIDVAGQGGDNTEGLVVRRNRGTVRIEGRTHQVLRWAMDLRSAETFQ